MLDLEVPLSLWPHKVHCHMPWRIFWEMVLQNHSPAVAMLTQLVDNYKAFLWRNTESDIYPWVLLPWQPGDFAFSQN
uniref:Uncharacterized protein n=1 Tax=Rhizophora mucronata TaxID=61149 RepID=A0A2P2LCA1_RHIMU